MLAYNKDFWIGFSANHINEPNRSLLNQESYVPFKLTIHGGVRIPLYAGTFKKSSIPVLSPSFVYKKQGNFEQLDIGDHFLYQPIIMGLWYRGIPLNTNVQGNFESRCNSWFYSVFNLTGWRSSIVMTLRFLHSGPFQVVPMRWH